MGRPAKGNNKRAAPGEAVSVVCAAACGGGPQAHLASKHNIGARAGCLELAGSFTDQGSTADQIVDPWHGGDRRKGVSVLTFWGVRRSCPRANLCLTDTSGGGVLG